MQAAGEVVLHFPNAGFYALGYVSYGVSVRCYINRYTEDTQVVDIYDYIPSFTVVRSETVLLDSS